jgi:glycosyltransferase involved in cell wall biosynthesis
VESTPAPLSASIDVPPPDSLAVGRGTALFVCGWCFHERLETAGLDLRLGDSAAPAMAHGMPRPDLRRRLRSERAHRSGFWGIVPIEAGARPGAAELTVSATLADGSRAEARLATIELTGSATDSGNAPAPAVGSRHPGTQRVAVSMATHEPPADLLERQVESLRAQTHRDWVCLVSDDRSSPEAFAALKRIVGDDPRFVVSRSERRLGFYRNFERALAMVPDDAAYVALSDQDDRWHPDKLEALLAVMPGAVLGYSDARVVGSDGRVRADTYWTHRRNNPDNLVSLVMTNSISGASALFRRELLDWALPFPPDHARFFHDHWLAIVAMSLGRVAYVPRPLYDYVQHDSALLGHERAQAWAHNGRGLPEKLRLLRDDPSFFTEHWRTTYFAEYCRTAVFAQVLLLRFGDRLSASRRRALERLIAADRSAGALFWLAARRLRRRTGRDETLDAEGRLLRAALWRTGLERLTGRLQPPARWVPAGARPPAVRPRGRRSP